GIGHAEQHAFVGAVEVEGAVVVDRERQPRRGGFERLAEGDLAADRAHVQLDADHGPDLARPWTGRADDGRRTNASARGVYARDIAAADLDVHHVAARDRARSAPARGI